MAKKKKIRVDFRKNRVVRTRQADLTRQFATQDDETDDSQLREERISGKGELTRRRTVLADSPAAKSGSEGAAGGRSRLSCRHACWPCVDLTSTVRSDRRHALSMRHAAAAQDAVDRSAARGLRRRPRAVPAGAGRDSRRHHRAGRAAARRAQPREQRAAADPGDECRSDPDRRPVPPSRRSSRT